MKRRKGRIIGSVFTTILILSVLVSSGLIGIVPVANALGATVVSGISMPGDVAVLDDYGWFYVVEMSTSLVRGFNSNNQLVWSRDASSPYIATGNGAVYVGDPTAQEITVLNSTTGAPLESHFVGLGGFRPKEIAVHPLGLIYVVGYVTTMDNTQVRIYNPDWSIYGTLNFTLATADHIDIDDAGNVFITYAGTTNQVQVFPSGGGPPILFTSTAGGSFNPRGIGVDGSYVYVADQGNNRIQKFTTSGVFLGMWGSSGSDPGQFNGPIGVAADSGKIYVGDLGNDRIQIFNSASSASVSVTPNPVLPNYNLHITGQVTPAATYPLEIFVTDPNANYMTLGTLMTDVYGGIDFWWFDAPPPVYGLWTLEVKDISDPYNSITLATTNFVVILPGINVYNVVTGVPPDSPWSYTINDTLGNLVQSFTLSAGGSTSFPSLGVAGDYLIAETTKFGYTTSMRINDTVVDNSQATVYLSPGDVVSVSFINSAMPAFATQYLGQAPPSDLNIQLPALKPIPVQSAWSVDISGNTIPDLVLGKPMAVLLNLADVALTPNDQVTVSVTFEGTTYSKSFAAADLGTGAIVGFSPIVPSSTGTKDITGIYQINSGNPIALTQTSITVKTTKSLSLYFAYLSKSSYGSVDQASFDLMAQNSVTFINAAYPIKEASVNIVYSGKSIAGSTKTGTTGMQADCVAVAAKAKSVMGTGAVGVAIGPNNTGLSNYFATFGKSGAAGVSFGTSTKGVVVLDGYYTAAAHEVAHTYGLYWGKPEQYQTDPPNGKTSSGVWPANNQWRTGYSFMGTAPYRTLDFSWVDDANTYRYLFNHTATKVADPEIVVVSGLIYKTGTVEILPDVPWYHFNQGTADTVPPGDYALKFVDANGNTLNITSFAADFFMHIDPGIGVGEDQIDTSSYGMVPLDSASFVFAAEYPSGTAKIQVINIASPLTPLAEVRAQDLVQVGNSVTFTQSGLPPGTSSWSVTLGGLAKSSTTNTITFTGVSSGSYPWNASAQVPGATGIRYVSSGTMDVPVQSSQSITYTKQYQVSFTVSPSGKGTVIPSSTAYYNEGSAVSISAVAQSNYAFYSWNTNTPSITFASSSSASTTATINGPGAITATFSYSVSGTSNIVISGSDNVLIITGGNHIIDCRHATSTTILKIGKGNNLILLGGGGNIVRETAGGNDAIIALQGVSDISIVANGNYVVTTGEGNDKIQITGNGNSVILAGNGNNIVSVSGSGSNAITTGSGDDVITVGDGSNTIFAGAGNDEITVGKGNNFIDGGAGYDVCLHGNGRNTIVKCEKK